MAYTSIHAIIGLKAENFIPRNKYLLSSIIIGILIPDFDLIYKKFARINFLHL